MIFKIFAIIGMLAGELTAIASDGKITVMEVINLGVKICQQVGLPMDASVLEFTQLTDGASDKDIINMLKSAKGRYESDAADQVRLE